MLSGLAQGVKWRAVHEDESSGSQLGAVVPRSTWALAGDVLGRVLVTTWGWCNCPLVSDGQACCEIPNNAQDSPPPRGVPQLKRPVELTFPAVEDGSHCPNREEAGRE